MALNMIDTDRAKDASAEELLQQLESDRAKGLTPEEAAKRLTEYGPNEIPEKKQSGTSV